MSPTLPRGPSRRRPPSLGRRLVLAVVAHSLLVIVSALALFSMQRALETDLEEATAAFVEEQWIADRVATAVMRQLVAASAYHTRPDPAREADFRGAGEEAYREIRTYLFRDLSAEQRLQLEAIREQHELLEVAAARSLELASRGQHEGADVAAHAMVDHSFRLQAATRELLTMREEDLEALRARQSERFRVLYAVGGLVALLLAGSSLIWGRYFHRRVARPLAGLGDGATRIRDGDLATRVPIPAEHELATVADSFNQMADSLALARVDLERRNRELEDAVSRLRETQAELVQSEKLGAMGRMMAGLAHELNNPLASVLGYGQILAERLDDEGGDTSRHLQRDYVQPIVSEAERARDLVRNLLRFSRKSDTDTAPVPLREAVEVVTRIRCYAFEQAGLALEVGPIPDVHVLAEGQGLQQVLLNVVNNAFEAFADRPSGDGNAVRIRVEREGGDIAVIVEDDGAGFVDPDRAFEPFYTTKAVGEGTGLGLAMVHRFMERCGGRVRATNRPEGGARVTLVFRDAGGDGAARPDVPATAPAVDLTALRVLVVEDEPPLRTLQRRILRRAGAVVYLATGGRQAREVLESEEVDVVVSDVKMPDGSGLELFHWVLRERPMLAGRFLFVTGDVGDPAIVALERERPESFLSKPFHKDDYLARVVALADGLQTV